MLQQGADTAGGSTATTCRWLYAHKEALWTFVRIEGIEPTNNLAEQAIRAAVIWRKLCYGTQTSAGSRYVERILTVVATCRLQQRFRLSLSDGPRGGHVCWDRSAAPTSTTHHISVNKTEGTNPLNGYHLFSSIFNQIFDNRIIMCFFSIIKHTLTFKIFVIYICTMQYKFMNCRDKIEFYLVNFYYNHKHLYFLLQQLMVYRHQYLRH